jgi:hypothetical protein
LLNLFQKSGEFGVFICISQKHERHGLSVFQNRGLREDIWTEEGGRDRRLEKTA